MTSPAEHAAISSWCGTNNCPPDERCDVCALAARADELQEECHEWNALYGRLDKKRRDAEARANELEREARKYMGLYEATVIDQSRLERAETALLAVKYHPDTPEHIREYVARAALGEQPQCEHRDHHFDRSLCACGAMHYYCDDCGSQIDDCAEVQP